MDAQIPLRKACSRSHTLGVCDSAGTGTSQCTRREQAGASGSPASPGRQNPLLPNKRPRLSLLSGPLSAAGPASSQCQAPCSFPARFTQRSACASSVAIQSLPNDITAEDKVDLAILRSHHVRHHPSGLSLPPDTRRLLTNGLFLRELSFKN